MALQGALPRKPQNLQSFSCVVSLAISLLFDSSLTSFSSSPDTRVGSAPLVHAVWKVQDFIDRPHVREELYRLCESRWRDRTIARLAIPEVREVLPLVRYQPCRLILGSRAPSFVQVLESKDPRARSFADIEAALSGGWPSREALFEGIETPWVEGRRRFFGLTWCKTRYVPCPVQSSRYLDVRPEITRLVISAGPAAQYPMEKRVNPSIPRSESMGDPSKKPKTSFLRVTNSLASSSATGA